MHTLASVGVIRMPTDGVLAILAPKHPTTAPPPITPTTTWGCTFLMSLAASTAAFEVLIAALARVFLVAA